jgi:hypothetical protein
MSTTIFVSRGKKLFTKNAVANTIATLTQAKIQATSTMDDVFEELFETVPLFSIFVIDRLDRDRFMKLFLASREARENYEANGPKGLTPFDSFSQVLSVWDELLTMMRVDERFAQSD